MEAALITRLQLDPAVSLLAADRISWFEFPRGAVAARVLLTVASSGREYSHDGPVGLDGPRVQADCLAGDPDTALALARAVRDVFEAGPDEIEGVRFWPGQQAGEFMDSETLDGGAVVFRVSRDFQFYHEEI